jgi:hypothetical protein
MSEIIDVITKLSFVAEDEGLKKTSAQILKNTAEIEKLIYERAALAEQQKKLSEADVAAQKKIFNEIKRVETAIKDKTKAVINERLASQDLNKELVKEIGYIANINAKLDALKTKKAMAATAGEAREVTKEIKKLSAELDSIEGKSKSGGGLLGSLLGGLGIGTGLALVGQVFEGLKGIYTAANQEFQDAEKSADGLERSLKSIGAERYFDGMIQEADMLAKKYKNLFDNDDIVKAQTQLVTYGKISVEEISKITPVIIELATAEGITLPAATETMIGILEGRGGESIRKYGLNLKGLKTEHELLNVILDQFKDKLEGSADAYSKTAEGMKQANEIMIASLEERLGKYTSKLDIIWKQTLLGFFQFIEDITTSADEARDNAFKETKANRSAEMKALSDKELNDQVRLMKLNAKEIQRLNQSIQDKNSELNSIYEPRFGGGKQKADELKQAIKADQDLFDQLLVKNGETYREYLRRKDKKKLALDKQAIDQQAKLAEENAAKGTKKAQAKQEDAGKKELQDQEALYQSLLQLATQYYEQSQLDTEKLNAEIEMTDGEYKQEQLLNEIKYYEERILIQEQFGKDTLKEQADLIRKREQLSRGPKPKSTIPPPINADFPGGTTGAVDISGQPASVLTKEGEQAAIERGKQARRDQTQDTIERNQQVISSFNDVNTIIMTVGMSLSLVNQQQIDTIDKQISAQEKRIDLAKKYAERGGAEMLEIEEERLARLEEKREKYARRQLQINAALALSNAIVAVTTTAAESGVASIATIPAVLGAIVAGYSFVKSLEEPQNLAEGTKEVKGPGTETSDSVPANLSKGERVVDAKRSKKFKAILDDIQDDRFVNQEDLVASIVGGKYMTSLNYKAIMESKNSNSSGGLDTKLLLNLNSTMQGVVEAIEEKPVAQMIADEKGFNLFYTYQQRRATKQSKY